MRTSLIAAFAVAVLSVVLTSSAAQGQSLGFFPATIELEQGLRGQRYESLTTLVNQSDEARVFHLEAAGAAAEWVTFALPDKPDTAITEVQAKAKGESQVIVRIDVPATAPNGAVQGVNSYESSPTQGGIVSSFQQKIAISVTGDQVLDLRVGDVSARDVEIGQPLRMRAQLTNRGNVDSTPDVDVSFERVDGGTAGDGVQASLGKVAPGKSRTAEVAWPTQGQQPGRYRGNYEVTLKGDRIGVGSFEFELQPAGALQRTGTVESVQIVGHPKAGGLGRADIVFRNSGEADVTAAFEGEVLRSGERIAAAESPAALTVPPGEEVTLSAYFALPEGTKGPHELTGAVVFGETAKAEANAKFDVGDSGSRWRLLVGGGGAILALLGVSVLTARRLARR